MPELPLYGAHSRIKIETAHDPRFQEIEMKVHYLREIDRPEFWAFIDKAINAFADELLDKPEPKEHAPTVENVTDAPKPEAQTDQQVTFTFHFPALEKEMATHSSVLAWRIPGVGEPGGLPSMGSHRIGHD